MTPISMSSFDAQTCSPTVAAWRTVASILLAAGLGWVLLSSAAWGDSEHYATAPAISSSPLASVGDMSPIDHITKTSEGFTLTVLSTNDTWGYLDPCG
jgi:hypothetical protein